LSTLLLALKLVLLVLWSLPRFTRTKISVLSAAVAMISTLALLLLSFYEHSRSLRPSSLICLYLLVSIIFEIAQVRTLWLLHPASYPLAATATIALTARSLLLLSETYEKGKCLSPQCGHISPESSTGIFSQSTYWWLNRFFISGFRDNLSLDDLYPLDEELSSNSTVSPILPSPFISIAKSTQRLALFLDVIYDSKWTVAAAVAPRLCLIGFKFAQPFLINDIIDYVSEKGSSGLSGVKYGFVGATVLVYVGIAVSTALYKRQAIRMVTMTRGSSVTMIYSKTLHQASDQCQEAGSTTLMSTDIDRIATGLLNSHELWASPVEIVIALVLLGKCVGYPSITALGIAMMSVLGSFYLAPQMRQMQKAWVHAVQERVNFTSVILKEMRQIKMFGIESDVAFKIRGLRELELHRSKPYRSMIVGVNVLGTLSTAIAPALTIAVYAATQLNLRLETPSTDVVFTSLSLISLLTNPVVLLSVLLTRFTSAIGCFDRIQEFLCKESRVNEVTSVDEYLAPENASGMELTSLLTQSSQPLVCMTDCCFSLGVDIPAILHGLTLKIQHASFSAVTGPIGSGKSSLLKAMLGEMHRPEGTLSVRSVKMAYCQQSPWIFNGTLRANIVGESPLDEEWLKEVVYACNLDVETTILSFGLDTVAGSSGAQLSGGQKQRVALARAIYARPSLLILDDIFGALDAVTSRLIFQRVLGRAGLVRRLGIATILVTIAVKHLKEADNLIVLSKDGRMEGQGIFGELEKRNQYLQSLSRSPSPEDDEVEESKESDSQPGETREVKKETGEMAERETVHKIFRGDGDFSLYTYYINSFGWWAFGLTLGFATLYVFCIAFPQVMLSWWCDSSPPKNYVYLGSYVGISSIAIIAMGVFIGAPWPSLAPIDTGNLINRFSQDMSLLDMQLPVAFGITLQNRNTTLLETSQKPFYTMYSIQQWLQVVLDLLVAGVATVLVALAVFVTKQSSSGAVGVALVNLLSFNSTLTLLITNWTQLETSLGAGARLRSSGEGYLLYTGGRTETWHLWANWKEEFFTCLYFSLSRRSHLAKSTFDGIDISTVPKEKLHSALVEISQNPLILPGSVRENISLGISSAIDDSEMMTALEGVGRWNQIRGHGGLSANIDSINLSNGQKQIFCIARAILSPGRVVIMDEPTSGFDEHTERLATELLRERLKGRTTISIAHQINTVMDSDLIMVIDQ
ncbi:ABC transporter integral membrane type 1, partial [Penicillium mononematosum]|uniref:ABC transporter integral membrane type 1 n=1 Tax=Penicillium mononematosum TaxID=268346 RepID=UPI0025487ABC